MKFWRTLLRVILGNSLPICSGEIIVEGINSPVVIHRDKYGIPYIKAKSERDAFFALGFCQGQDRSFQIERLIRTTRGSLSEVFGPQTLDVDRLTLRVGLKHYAHEQTRLLDNYDQELLNAFAVGVNAGVSSGCRRPAPEFRLLGIQPSHMDAADPLAILNFVAFILSPWPYKINRMMILREYGPEVLQNLDGLYPEWIPATIPVGQPAGSSGQQISDELRRIAGLLGMAGGSNSWAVNAFRSKTGRPLLANDPHLSPTIPSHWYLACVEIPDNKMRGAFLAGTPFLSIGHNYQAAWGMTGGSADNTDLFLEELDQRRTMVREEESFQPLEIISQTIQVKGQEPFKDKIYITSRGPIISDVLEDIDLTLSIRAVWMNPQPIPGLFDIYRVKSFQEFQSSWSSWYQATLNMIYADTSDNIGWQFIGDIPVRKTSPTIPLPGWKSDFNWDTEMTPFQHLPSCLNPDSGFIATANAKPSGGENIYLGFDFPDGYRLARITEVLKKRQDWDLPGMGALQLDELALPWREIRDIILSIPGDRDQIREALEILSSWDGLVSADSSAAALYEFFLSELLRNLAETHTPNSQEWVLGKELHPLLYASLGKRQVSHISRSLRDGSQDIFTGSRKKAVGRALERALTKLKEEYGKKQEDWAWGRIRPLILEHPFGGIPLLGRIFNRGPYPWGGDSQTVSQAQRSLKIPTYNPTGIANLRMALDVGGWENNFFVLAGGQSGNPLSPHYDDQIPLWREGEGIILAWSEESITAIIINTLRLEPHNN